MLRQSFAAVGLLKLMFIFLWEATLAYPVERVPSWILNPNDQVAVSLVEMFKTNKDYKEREFVMLSNTTKVTSRDAFYTKEFRPACFFMANKERSAPFGTVNPLLMICNKIEVHELAIDKATGRVTSTALVFTAPVDHDCLAVDWSKDLNTYGVFCVNSKEGTTGFLHVHLIDGNTKVTTGSKSYDLAGLKGYKFNERVNIQAVKVPKGGLESDTVFLIFDEPYPDFDLNVNPKNNYFVIMVDVESATKKPKSFQVLDLSKKTELVPGNFQKFLTFQVINSKLYFAWFTNAYLPTFGRCEFNTNVGASVQLDKCTILKSEVTFRFGTISITPSGLVGVFNKHEQKYSVCTLDDANPTNILQGCKPVAGRTDSDVTVEHFESWANNQLAITYRNKDKTKHIGVDRFTINATAVTVFNKFKTLADASRENNGRYYTSIDTFLDAFDDNRTEEMILQAKILFPDKWHKIQVQMIHQGVTKLENYTYYRLERSISNIGLAVPGGFPRLMGFKQKLFRIPLGREYFKGNAISFNFSAPNVKTVISNAGSAKVTIGSIIPFVNTLHVSSGLQVISLDKEKKIDIFNCKRRIESNTHLNCSLLAATGLSGDVEIVGMYETPQVLMIVTNNSFGVAYDKVQGEMRKLAFQTESIASASFKARDSVIQIALLGVYANKSRVIQIHEWNQYNIKETYYKPFITGYTADLAQETAGDFCPKSVEYNIEDIPILVVLNSCATKDRRIIRFNLIDPDKPVQLSNRYIRVPEIKQENLMMCPDLETVIIAAPGTTTVLGIGYDTYNMIQDLSLAEMSVKEVKKLVCLSDKAFGVGFLDVNNTFKIATFYTYKMRTADRKLHSVVDFAELPDYVDFVGSEGHDIVFYNVYSSDPNKKAQKAIYLDGPLLYMQSDTRSIVNDAVIGTMNGYQNNEFNLMVSMVEQKESVTVESRTSKVPLGKRVYNMEELSVFRGPVFTFDHQSFLTNPIATFTPRVEPATEFVDRVEASSKGYLFASKVTDIGTTIDIVFTLLQKNDSSVVQVRHMNGGTNVSKQIAERCHQIRVLDADEGYQVFLSCFYKSEFRFFYYLLSKQNGEVLAKRYSNVTSRATILEVAKLDDKGRHLIGTIDDRDNLLLWAMDTRPGPGTDGLGKADSTPVYSQEGGKLSYNFSEECQSHQECQTYQRAVLQGIRLQGQPDRGQPGYRCC